jgi:uncharacterized protein (TIGR03067 family)
MRGKLKAKKIASRSGQGRLDNRSTQVHEHGMKLRCFLAAIVAVVALIFTQAARADDLKAMEGKWRLESAEAGGKKIEAEELKDLVVTITGDRYELMAKDGPDAGTLKLDETQKPKAMDATDTEGLDAGKVIRAIYELSGDTLRVCYALKGEERPRELTTSESSPWLLITYKREK